MKTVNEVLQKLKGEDKVDETICGKGSFSKAAFSDITNALINDTTFKVEVLDKQGKATEVNFSELFREELKKNIASAGYPQKPEIGVVDNANLYGNVIAEMAPHLIDMYVATGRKFEFPLHKDRISSVYLVDVKGKTKDTTVRDMKTGEKIGTTTTTTQDHIQMRVKSQVPKALVKKVRKDLNGNVVSK